MPPLISSGFSLLLLALEAGRCDAFASPVRLFSLAFLITGTIRLPSEGLWPFLFYILLLYYLYPSTEMFIIGKSYNALAAASMENRVRVSF